MIKIVNSKICLLLFFVYNNDKFFQIIYKIQMISNLAKYFLISNELKENEKLDIISNEIIKAMQNENNIYKWILLVGINNIFKIFKIFPGLE